MANQVLFIISKEGFALGLKSCTLPIYDPKHIDNDTTYNLSLHSNYWGFLDRFKVELKFSSQQPTIPRLLRLFMSA